MDTDADAVGRELARAHCPGHGPLGLDPPGGARDDRAGRAVVAGDHDPAGGGLLLDPGAGGLGTGAEAAAAVVDVLDELGVL